VKFGLLANIVGNWSSHDTIAETLRISVRNNCLLSQTLKIESHGARLPRSAHLYSEDNLSSTLMRHPVRFAMLSTERQWFLQMPAPEDTTGQ
jgi:hypothetical protein